MNTIVVVLAAALGFAQQNDDLARLEKLIAIPSVSSNVVEVNRAVDFLSEELRRDGLWCRIETMPGGRRVLFAANVGLEGTFDWIHQTMEVYVPKSLSCEFKPEIDLRVFFATGTAHFDELVVEEVK